MTCTYAYVSSTFCIYRNRDHSVHNNNEAYICLTHISLFYSVFWDHIRQFIKTISSLPDSLQDDSEKDLVKYQFRKLFFLHLVSL